MMTETNQPRHRGKRGLASLTQPVTCGQGLRLDAGEESAPATWNVVAYEGEFSGHSAGSFSFTRETFAQIVANFQGDPRYAARKSKPAAGEATAEDIASGAYDVVQWDFHHASEMMPTSGNISAQGAPAQGWVLDVKVGEYEGKCALLALSRFLEPAKGYIKAGQYKWCSVSVWLNAPDPVSGTEKGATLTSIAVTNNPFLQGLPTLRASKEAAQMQLGYYSAACNIDEAFECMRRCLGLPETADVAAVASEVAKLKQWSGPNAAPPGVDVADIVGSFRQILSLPLLSTADEVFVAVDALLTRITTSPEAGKPAASSAIATEVSAAKTGPLEKQIMSTNASGIAPGIKAEALPVAGPDLRGALAKMCATARRCSTDEISDNHIINHINAMVESSAGLQSEIDQLMAEIGAKTLAEAIVKITSAKELQVKLQEALAGKKEVEDAMSVADEATVEEDVSMALASLGMATDASKADKVKRALLAERGKSPESIAEFRKTYDLATLRAEARAEIAKVAQKIVADRAAGTVAPPHITASVAGERQTPPAVPQNDAPAVDALKLTMGADGRITLGGPVSREPAPGEGKSMVTLSTLRASYPHEPNDYLRKVAFAKAEYAKNNPNAKALSHDSACEQAHDMRLAG